MNSSCTRVAVMLLVAAVGCREPLAPQEVIGTYVLESISAQPVPVFRGGHTILADTLTLGENGRGTRLQVMESHHPSANRVTRVASALAYRIVGNTVRIMMLCPPGAACLQREFLIARPFNDRLWVENTLEKEQLSYRPSR